MGKRFIAIEALEALAAKAMAAGVPLQQWRDGRPRRWLTWDISGDCQASATVNLHARWSATHGKVRAPLEVTLATRCRKCDRCRDLRRRQWTRRAANEYRGSYRTWFCTFTARPEVQLRWHYAAALARSKAGVDFEGEPANSKFQWLCKYGASPEITRFLKRVRKNSGAPMRYFLVGEMHKSGLPHFHALLHESGIEQPIRKAVIKTAWQAGFSKVVLCRSTWAALYCAKYLSKENVPVRVRASSRYGNRQIDIQSFFEDRSTLVDRGQQPASDPSPTTLLPADEDPLGEVGEGFDWARNESCLGPF